MANSQTILSRIGSAAGLLIVLGIFRCSSDTSNFDPNTPTTITSMFSSLEAPSFQLVGDTVILTYNIDGRSRRSYLVKAREFYEKIFQVKGVEEACLDGNDNLVDIRGHKTNDRLASTCFYRTTASGIEWRNVDVSNIPRLADSRFFHPAFN